jgi:ribosomal protein S18 acetylase RimI-like enzyme
VAVVGSAGRTHPGWDGRVYPGLALTDGSGTVLSVPPDAVAGARRLAGDLAERGFGPALASAVGLPTRSFERLVFRWSEGVPALPEPGVWVPRDDPRVPQWLRPFNGDVLVVVDADGAAVAGAGRKQHDRYGHELAVGTDPEWRGRGLARQLVAQMARRVLFDAAVCRGSRPSRCPQSGRRASWRASQRP